LSLPEAGEKTMGGEVKLSQEAHAEILERLNIMKALLEALIKESSQGRSNGLAARQKNSKKLD
jgi:hypothetical protein